MKAHRLGWRIGEVPARWFERSTARADSACCRWLPAYLRWYGYAFATTWLRRPPATVVLPGAELNRNDRMAGKWPKIRARSTTKVSPWMNIIAREVEFARGEPPQLTTRSNSPITSRSSRAPSPGAFRWCSSIARQWRSTPGNCRAGRSIPAKMPPKPAAANSWRRPGSRRCSIHRLGDNSPCTGRLNNRIQAFFVETGEQVAEPEPGMVVEAARRANLSA